MNPRTGPATTITGTSSSVTSSSTDPAIRLSLMVEIRSQLDHTNEEQDHDNDDDHADDADATTWIHLELPFSEG